MVQKKEEKGGRKRDKIYLVIFIVVAIIVGGISWWVFQNGMKEIEKNGAGIQEAGIKKEETGEIDTSNWETYVNEEYGYSLKVPEGWGAKELRQDKEPTPSILYIDSKPILTIPTDTSYSTPMSIYISTLNFQKEVEITKSPPESIHSESEVIIDGVTCTKLSGIDEMYEEEIVTIICPFQSQNYIIAYTPKNEYKKEISSLLSTFKFTK